MLAKRALAAIAIGLGFLSTTSQVIILRELLVAFTGNELTLATALATWLLSIAAGCFILRRIAGTGKPAVTGLLFIIAAPTVAFQVILLRFVDPMLGGLGEIMSPLAVMGLSAATIMPGAVILGGLFVAVVALARQSFRGRVVPLVYGFEALGSGAAGALLSAYVLEATDSFFGLALAGLAGLACAGYMAFRARPPAGALRKAVVFLLFAGLVGVMALSRQVDLGTRRAQWHPMDVAATKETRYGNILVTRRDHLYDFFENGSLSHTIPDPLYAEETAHIPLLYHPAPRHVLVIGGAGSGVINEIGRHTSVAEIDFVELDPQVIRMTEDFAPAGWLRGAPGTVVTPVYGDGRRFVAESPGGYDVVILSLGLPVTLQTARYYTVEFFRDLRRVLAPDGVLAFKIPSGGAYLGPELGSLLASLKNACEEVYEEVTLLPGDYIHVIASTGLPLAALTDSLPSVLAERGIATSFLDRYRLTEQLNPLERAYLDSVAASYDTGMLNSDGRPVSATYAIARWAKHFGSGRFLASLVGGLTQPVCVMGLLVSALIVVPLLVKATGLPWSTLPGTVILYAMGLTAMFTQVLIIVAFQIASGYVYGWIAAIIAAFMVGMGLASSLMGMRRLDCRWYHLAYLAAGLACLPLAAANILRYRASLAVSLPAEVPFMALALVSGGLGGSIFAAASAFLTAKGGRVIEAGVLAYSLDLSGATVAGFTTGFLIIPSLGITASANAVAAFNGVLVAGLIVWGAVSRMLGPGLERT
jgi:spermidine synthase